MNHKNLKFVLLASFVLAAIACFAPVANAGWWWGAAPEGCGLDSCGCGSCYGGGRHHGCHHGCYHACYGGCWTGWDPCWGSCYPSTWSQLCCGGCSDCCGTVVSSCGCGGVPSGAVIGGTLTVTGSASNVPTPAPTTTTPATPSPAPATPATTVPSATGPAPSPPALGPSATPGATPPLSAPEGGLPLPTPSKSGALERMDSGLLTVWVPYDAKVTINGIPTKCTGSRRQFVSYGLKPGYTYTYEVKADVARERPWTANTTYTDGQVVRNQGTGNFYVCVTGGASGTSAPSETWVGETFQDGSVKWRNVGPDYRGPGYRGMTVSSTQTVSLTAGGREGVAFGFNTPVGAPVEGAQASN